MQRYSPSVVKIFDDVTVDCPVAYADVTLGAAETMLMESFVLGTPTVSAVYWKPAKPVTELHKYIPHSINPLELAKQTINFFDSEVNSRFRELAKNTVDRMENPVEKMVLEINKMFGFSSSGKKVPRRSRIEILAQILQSVSYQSMIFSHIMQRVNITHRELRNDLVILEKNRLIERIVGNGSRIHFRTTTQGLQTLEDFRRIADAFNL
jgi:predicted transcriptional regulator